MGNPYPPTDPSEGNYPQQPQQGGYGYPPQPQPGSYGYPPQQPQPGFPPQQPQPGFPPPQQGYPPQQPAYGIPGQPPQGSGYPAYPQQGGFPPSGAPALPPIPPKRGNNRLLSIIITVVVIALISGVGTILGRLGKSASSPGNGAYSSQLIGSGCDKGAAHWENGIGATLQGVCQSDGYLVTQSSSFEKIGEIFFDGTTPNQAFPQSYEVQIDATLKSGGGFTGAGLEVHTQNPNAGDIFTARANSEWFALGSDASGDFKNRLGVGFLSQATSTVHLDVQVVGAVMPFSINGVAVDTVVDTKYTTTTGIDVALSNNQATSPFSVLFSNFQYEPLTTVPLSATDAAATATVQVATTHPYTAAVPGPGCDKGGAQWAAPSVFGDTGTTTKCVAGALQVSETATDQNLGVVRFYDRNGIFPLNYSASVVINVSKLPGGGCAGILVSPSGTAGDVTFLICSDGTWLVLQYDSSGKPTPVKMALWRPKRPTPSRLASTAPAKR